MAEGQQILDALKEIAMANPDQMRLWREALMRRRTVRATPPRRPEPGCNVCDRPRMPRQALCPLCRSELVRGRRLARARQVMASCT